MTRPLCPAEEGTCAHERCKGPRCECGRCDCPRCEARAELARTPPPPADAAERRPGPSSSRAPAEVLELELWPVPDVEPSDPGPIL
jgi:hypothetical protein